MTDLPFKTVAVLGAGAMGRGIAQLAAEAGSQVLLYDAKASAADDAKAFIEKLWRRDVEIRTDPLSPALHLVGPHMMQFAGRHSLVAVLAEPFGKGHGKGRQILTVLEASAGPRQLPRHGFYSS